MKEEIGTYGVKTEDRKLLLVVVSQEVVFEYSKERKTNQKYLNLHHLHGPEVFKTDDPNVLKLADGTMLRKRKVMFYGNTIFL